MNRRSRQTIGEAWPLPGSCVFQAILLAAPQWTGTWDSRLVPSPRGPRQAGQFSARARLSEAIRPRQQRVVRSNIIGFRWLFCQRFEGRQSLIPNTSLVCFAGLSQSPGFLLYRGRRFDPGEQPRLFPDESGFFFVEPDAGRP